METFMLCILYHIAKQKNKSQDGDHYRRRKKKGLERATTVPRVSTQVLRLLYLLGTLPISSLPIYTYIHRLYMPASSATTHVYYVPYFTGSKAHILKNLISLKLNDLTHLTINVVRKISLCHSLHGRLLSFSVVCKTIMQIYCSNPEERCIRFFGSKAWRTVPRSLHPSTLGKGERRRLLLR